MGREERRKLKFRVSKDGSEIHAVEEYCRSVDIDPRDVQYALGQISIALKRLMPGKGVKQLKWVCLQYFFAGLHLGRTRPKVAEQLIKQGDTKDQVPSYVG